MWLYASAALYGCAALLFGCAGVAPINTPLPPAPPLAETQATELSPNPTDPAKASDAPSREQVTGKEVLTQRNDEGCVLVSGDGDELACVNHTLVRRDATTQWRFFSVRNEGAMTAAYTVYDGPSDGSGVQLSELARVNERLRLGEFTRAPNVMRADHQLGRFLRGTGMTRTLHWEERSTPMVLPMPSLQDAIVNEDQVRRCCDWQPVAVSVLESYLALMLRLDCKFSGDVTRKRNTCYVEGYGDDEPFQPSEVVIAPKP